MTRSINDLAFEKLDRDLAKVMDCFTTVLLEQGEAALAARLPWTGTGHADDGTELSDRAMQALSMAFQFLNMVEENAANQARRAFETQVGLSQEPGLWGRALAELAERGFTAEQVAKLLPQLRIEPVLTAHPTESKRPTVLEHHRAMYLLLVKRENQMWTPHEQDEIRDELTASIERLWRTGEVRLSKPDVASERRSVIRYLRDIFPDVLVRLDQRLRHAWRERKWDESLIDDPDRLPRLRFGSWVGGDRDGHPLVTGAVTRETLQELRLGALAVHHRHLTALAEGLSLSDLLQPVPSLLVEAIARLRQLTGAAGEVSIQRNPHEPWRQYINLVQVRLGDGAEPVPGYGYRTWRDYADDLAVLRRSLLAVGAHRLARGEVFAAERVVRAFGFHLASLDVRQNSAVHEKALAQLLTAAGIEAANWSEWSEKERLALLDSELRSPRPLGHPEAELGAEAKMVLESYRVLADHRRVHGRDGIGSLIVSMTRSLSDLLTVFVLAREVGLARWVDDTQHGAGLACELPVVPLFETIGDLQGATEILGAFLRHPVVKRSLALQGTDTDAPFPGLDRSARTAQDTGPAAGGGRSVQAGEWGILRGRQQVMLGYSDSCKDGGIVASMWNLHRAQASLSACARQEQVEVRFFHGRGGTVSRGAGPTHRFLEALPHGSLCGDLRLTEQGETIAQKYSNPVTATWHLELLLAGVAVTTIVHRAPVVPDDERTALMDRLSGACQQAYEALLNTDGFLTYFAEATPIDVLEQASIGSRPARRSGKRTFADLRAIPWVFSWNQSRHYLPGWYGLGSGLAAIKQDPTAWERLRREVKGWPFLRYALSNIESNVASVREDLLCAYAGLVRDTGLRERFRDRILAELRLTGQLLDEVFGGTPLKTRRPRLVRTIDLRDDGLRALHRTQVTLIRRWRDLRDANRTDEANAALPTLLLSVNAIAAGLRTTG